MEVYPNLLEDKSTTRFEDGLQFFKELGIGKDEYRISSRSALRSLNPVSGERIEIKAG